MGTRTDHEDEQPSCPLLRVDVAHVGHHSINTKVEAKGSCGALHAIANCLALLIGLGVLSSPYAVARGGYASLVLNGLVALAYYYTTLLLVRCLQADPHLADYLDVSKKAFGQIGYWLAMAIMFVDVLSALVSYGISLSDNLESVIPNADQLAIVGFRGRYLLMSSATLVLLPMVWVRNLKSLAWVSASSIVSSIIVVIALVWMVTLDAVGLSQPIALWHLDGLPMASGIYLFTYGANIILPSIRTSMIDRSKFPKVLSLSFLIAAMFYGGIGVLGASMFGSQTESQITLNMPLRLTASKLAIWANIITALMKFSILLRPVAVEVESMLPWHADCTMHVLVSIVIRSMLVILLILVSLSLPYFAYVVSFVGSSLEVTLCLIIPCWVYWRLFQSSIKIWEVALLLLIMTTGGAAGIVGIIDSIARIYEHRT